jgi:hypothetical protein
MPVTVEASSIPESGNVTETRAPGIPRPVGSCIVPESLPVTCAETGVKSVRPKKIPVQKAELKQQLTDLRLGTMNLSCLRDYK